MIDHRLFKQTLIITIIISLFLIFNCFYYTNNAKLETQVIVTEEQWTNSIKVRWFDSIKESDTANRTILYWNRFWHNNDIPLGFGYDIFQNCAAKNCILTYNKSYTDLENFDAVIIHMPTFSLKHDGWPASRSYKQKYIFFSLESGIHLNYEKDIIKNYFNWTMTFRRDSDIYFPNARILEKLVDYKLPSEEFVKSKPKKIAWFVSNCSSKKRLDYVHELQNYIPVDIYGECGNLICSRSNETECYKMMEQNYKFYLAFENTMCEDYITEKLYNVLHYNIVPIVMGGGDYKKLAPPNSVINVNDFKDPKDLAIFLWKLSDNPREYLKYFEWKSRYFVKNDDFEHVVCQLCSLLKQPIHFSLYKDVQKWYSDTCYH